MRKSLLTLVSGIIICGLCCYQILTSMVVEPDDKNETGVAEEDLQPLEKQRESITFILGEDKDEHNRYYREALLYYTHNPEGRTDRVVGRCRSLLEARDYLEKNKPANGEPWGLINLVSHGNQWVGLSVRVTPDSKRANAERLQEAITRQVFKPLPKTIADRDTEIFVHGCGLGNNHQLIDAIATAFGGHENKPIVRAPRLFEYYASVGSSETVESQRYLAQTFMMSYKMGERPNTNDILNFFQEKHPGTQIDWRVALTQEQPRWIGDPYFYTFEVPVKWVVPVHVDSIPDVGNHKSRLEWINKRKQIRDELKTLNLPMDKFTWSLNRVYINHEDGSESPGIFVKGYCTILAVLQPLTVQRSEAALLERPFVPDINDDAYYYSTRPVAFSQLVLRRK
jgi:hypothetical protein